MNNQNPFYDRMNALSDEELLKVLSLKEEYNPEAGVAAEVVFKERKLSEEVIANINEDIQTETKQQEEQLRKKKEKIDEALSIVSVFSNGVSTEFDKKQIKGFKLLIIGLALYYLYGVYGVYPYIEIVFLLEDLSSLSLLVETLISIVIFPTGIFLLARLKKEGWIILFFIFTSKLLLIVGMTLFGIYYQIDLWMNPKPPSIFGGFGQEPDWINNLLLLLTQGGIVWYFLKDSVMRLVKVDPRKKRFYIVTASIVSVIYIVFFLLMVGVLR
tara:strand:- start:2889 stop:3701 length:813 start_codon:yes stop_codon:yes gene_type:complete